MGDVIFLDAECPKCGYLCGNNGHGDVFYCYHCGWSGHIEGYAQDMAIIQELFRKHQKNQEMKT